METQLEALLQQMRQQAQKQEERDREFAAQLAAIGERQNELDKSLNMAAAASVQETGPDPEGQSQDVASNGSGSVKVETRTDLISKLIQSTKSKWRRCSKW